MYLKKCKRCGCFYSSSENTCENCKSKDELEINKLKNYFENYSNISSIQGISLDTGITVNNLNRFLQEPSFKGYVKQYNLKF